MYDLNNNLVNLNRSQINKLKKGETVTLKPENFQDGNISLMLDNQNQKKVIRNLKQGKGVRVKLSMKELQGNGFFDDVGDFFTKTIPKTASKVLPVVASPAIDLATTAIGAKTGPLGYAVASALGNEAKKAIGGGIFDTVKNIATPVGKVIAKKGVDMAVQQVGARTGDIGSALAKAVGNEAKKQIGDGFFDTVKNIATPVGKVIAKKGVDMAVQQVGARTGDIGSALAKAVGSEAKKAIGNGILIKPIRAMNKPLQIKGAGRGRGRPRRNRDLEGEGLFGDIANFAGKALGSVLGGGSSIKPLRGPGDLLIRGRGRGRPRKGGALLSKKNLNKLKNKATPLLKDVSKMGTKEASKFLKDRGLPSDLVNALQQDVNKMIDQEKLIVPKGTLLEGVDELQALAKKKIEGMGATVYQTPVYKKTMQRRMVGGSLMTLSPHLAPNNPAMHPFIPLVNEYQGYNKIRGNGIYPAGRRGDGIMSPYQSMESPAMNPYIPDVNQHQGYAPIRGNGMYPAG